MALDGTYAGLQASVADWLNRSDLTALVPDLIAMATGQISDRLLKDGPIREMMGRSDATINAEFITVPTDFRGNRSFYLGANYLPLEYVDPEEIVRRKTLYPSQDGDPQAYTVVGGQFQFWPWNGSTFSGEIAYWKAIPALSVSNTSNWLLTRRPDIYLTAALTNSAPYLADDERLNVWGTMAATGIADLVGADKISRTSTNLGLQPVPGGTP